MASTISYELLTSEHSKNLAQLVQDHFRPDNPLSKALGVTHEEFQVGGDMLIASVLKEDPCISYVAVDRTNGQVVGCRLTSSLKRGTIEEHHDLAILGPKLQKIMTYVEALEGDVLADFPDAENIFKFRVLCVDKKYRGMGIAQELTKRSIDLARSLNYNLIITSAVALSSQKLFEKKFGFLTHRILNAKEFRFNDQLIYENIDSEDEYSKFMFLKL